MKPLAIDLYAGLGGWTEGLLAAGFDVVGFDVEQHVYGEHRYPAQLVLQDVRTLHGSQFKDASLIVASSPCQEFSYRAMPWKRAKALGPPLLGMELFAQAARIQREASAAAGRYIPMIQENVKGAQKYVGRAQWHYGSYYLWGDVPALMPIVVKAQKFNPDGTAHGQGSWFAIADSKNRGARSDGVKVPGMNWSGSDQPGYRAVAFNDTRHIKNDGGSWFNIGSPGQKVVNRNPVHRESHQERVLMPNEGIKCGGDWFGPGVKSEMRKHSSKSKARKAASAKIAKIPFDLAMHIGEVYYRAAMERVA